MFPIKWEFGVKKASHSFSIKWEFVKMGILVKLYNQKQKWDFGASKLRNFKFEMNYFRFLKVGSQISMKFKLSLI